MVIFLLFDCLLTVFDEWYTVPIVKNTRVQIVTGLPGLYQQCTNRQKQSKQHTTGVPVVTCLPRLYQPCTMQQCTKNSQKTLKTTKMTIGVPTVTILPRLYQQCNNSLPIVNKNLAIANRSRVELRTQYVEGIHRPKYYTVTLKYRLRVTQGHWKRNH